MTRIEQDSLSYLAPARVRVVATTSNAVMSASALEYVASAVLLFPTVANMAEAEERIRVLGALGIVSKLAQVCVRRVYVCVLVSCLILLSNTAAVLIYTYTQSKR